MSSSHQRRKESMVKTIRDTAVAVVAALVGILAGLLGLGFYLAIIALMLGLPAFLVYWLLF